MRGKRENGGVLQGRKSGLAWEPPQRLLGHFQLNFCSGMGLGRGKMPQKMGLEGWDPAWAQLPWAPTRELPEIPKSGRFPLKIPPKNSLKIRFILGFSLWKSGREGEGD